MITAYTRMKDLYLGSLYILLILYKVLYEQTVCMAKFRHLYKSRG